MTLVVWHLRKWSTHWLALSELNFIPAQAEVGQAFDKPLEHPIGWCAPLHEGCGAFGTDCRDADDWPEL